MHYNVYNNFDFTLKAYHKAVECIIMSAEKPSPWFYASATARRNLQLIRAKIATKLPNAKQAPEYIYTYIHEGTQDTIVALPASFNYSVGKKNAARKASLGRSTELDLKLTYGKNELPMPKGPKYIVVLTWFNKKHNNWDRQMGTIIGEDVILTTGRPQFTQIKEGYCILSYDLAGEYELKNTRKWKTIHYYDEETDKGKKSQQFALIKLEEKINLDGVEFTALDINFRFKSKANWLTDDVTDAFVVYGTPNITNVAADNLNKIKYKQVVSFSKPPFKPSDIQITLIKLEKGMKLNNEKSAKLLLSKTKYPLKASRCFVVVTSTEDINRPSGTKLKSPKTETFVKDIEISLWTYNECKDYVKGINASQFCIRIHDSVDENDHCKYIQAGSPVICNRRLTGIVNDMTPCKRAQPRPCTNIHPLKEWISSNMREPKREAEKQEVSTEKQPKVAPKKATATKYVSSIIVILLTLIYLKFIRTTAAKAMMVLAAVVIARKPNQIIDSFVAVPRLTTHL
uniref:Peptidase S1 domain-containing protein n=1 Tax=Glossina pallidipes TaxID=7398 RepID=A0A1B0ACS2_GLOPL